MGQPHVQILDRHLRCKHVRRRRTGSFGLFWAICYFIVWIFLVENPKKGAPGDGDTKEFPLGVTSKKNMRVHRSRRFLSWEELDSRFDSIGLIKKTSHNRKNTWQRCRKSEVTGDSWNFGGICEGFWDLEEEHGYWGLGSWIG